jgi:hypothetical protein
VHVVPPTVSEYMPALQFVQAPLPDTFLYLPAGHTVHRPPFGPVKPTLQVQAVSAELDPGEFELAGQRKHDPKSAEEYVPDAQDVHAAEPVVFLYFPAVHALHGLPSRFTFEHMSRQALQQTVHVLSSESSHKQFTLLSPPGTYVEQSPLV